jgi:hypothetical protein
MCGPPDQESERAALAGSPNRKPDFIKPDQDNEAGHAGQHRSSLELQAFCLIRRFAFSLPLAEAVALLLYGSARQ